MCLICWLGLFNRVVNLFDFCLNSLCLVYCSELLVLLILFYVFDCFMLLFAASFGW